ncbi:NADPH-dependent quinone oxidoreductase [Rhizoctonia solani AG-3 Rhs1AP]|uniref:Probable quinone oxidoreductase n=2 Tax=Rhizoctonia solani AG-3 TaxID=1086053 RepID=A0A074RIH5_9AGAM|nr:NADPH-dependent quinone oxidoreductase [Rhizoctonia solani AG-3 Rhs1AP]KEP46594.1 NADPH-dependent quinone oxidoreductase [Rhizoctonia solani 123E]
MLSRPIHRFIQVSRQIIPQGRLLQAPHFTRFISTSYTRGFAAMAPIPKTMKAARVNKQGGIEELEVVEIPVPTPKPEEIVIKTEWAGVNFIDTYFRGGVYPRETPFTLGQEAAGTIAVLPSSADVLDSNDYKVRGFKEGSKVVALASGGFAEYVAVPWTHVQTLPEGADTRQGAVSLLQGLTALTFVKEAYPIKKGDWILVHAAAGGVGLLLVQLASQFGATVIGTTSSQAKAEIAKKAGATHIINYTESSVPDEVLKLTNGRGVEAIFDGVGASTWEGNFTSIRRKGTIVSFGNASGVIPPFSVLKLGAKNIKVCRPVVNNYVTDATEFHQYANELFDLIKNGKLACAVHAEYPFSTEGMRQTHLDITGRGTSGKLVVKMA